MTVKFYKFGADIVRKDIKVFIFLLILLNILFCIYMIYALGGIENSNILGDLSSLYLKDPFETIEMLSIIFIPWLITFLTKIIFFSSKNITLKIFLMLMTIYILSTLVVTGSIFIFWIYSH